MVNLGEFGAAQREANQQRQIEDPDTFTFAGVEFKIYGHIPAILMLQLGAAAGSGVDDSEGMAACWQALRCALTKPASAPGEEPDAEQFRLFLKTAEENNTEIEDLLRIVFAVYESVAGRPTGPVPASSGGAPTTSPSSNTSSSTHPGLAHLRPVADLLGTGTG